MYDRPCGNCGKLRNEHIEVRRPLDFNTPIGFGHIPPPLAVLCPTSVFIEERE